MDRDNLQDPCVRMSSHNLFHSDSSGKSGLAAGEEHC